MDYEKKDFRKLYKDLVKSDWFNRAYHDKSLGDCPFDIPELAESEDERIRKEIQEFLRDNCGAGQEAYKKCEEWCYWLEKKKEQKPVENTCGACCDDERFEIIAQAKKDIIEKTNIAENELSMELPLLDGILLRVWQVGWLNKKPVEWSEEDTEMYINVASSLRGYACGLENEEHKKHIKKGLDWLKSLHPSWRPSEEHLSALLAILNDPNNIGSQTCQLALTNLYEQIKKLV